MPSWPLYATNSKSSKEDEDTIPSIRKFKKRIGRLNDWWGAKMLADVDGEQCRKFVKERGNKGGSRRDLEDLRAAIDHHAAEGYHRGIVKITLPAKGEPRDKWLTRSDAAKLIWTCWRYREIQKMSRGPMKGQKVATGKRPLRHLARFILVGIYSGSRAGAIAAASPIPAIGRAFVDLDRSIYYRRKQGSARTNKRQPPVPIPAASARSSSTLASDRTGCEILRRVQRPACDIREDGVQKRGAAR